MDGASPMPVRLGSLVETLYKATAWSCDHLPWGLRSVLGLLSLALGIFGFLPIIGFWMIPLGIGLIALDVPPWRTRVIRWLRDQRSH